MMKAVVLFAVTLQAAVALVSPEVDPVKEMQRGEQHQELGVKLVQNQIQTLAQADQKLDKMKHEADTEIEKAKKEIAEQMKKGKETEDAENQLAPIQGQTRELLFWPSQVKALNAETVKKIERLLGGKVTVWVDPQEGSVTLRSLRTELFDRAEEVVKKHIRPSIIKGQEMDRMKMIQEVDKTTADVEAIEKRKMEAKNAEVTSIFSGNGTAIKAAREEYLKAIEDAKEAPQLIEAARKERRQIVIDSIREVLDARKAVKDQSDKQAAADAKAQVLLCPNCAEQFEKDGLCEVAGDGGSFEIPEGCEGCTKEMADRCTNAVMQLEQVKAETASCHLHDQCAALGMTQGNCCPMDKPHGTMLDCCDTNSVVNEMKMRRKLQSQSLRREAPQAPQEVIPAYQRQWDELKKKGKLPHGFGGVQDSAVEKTKNQKHLNKKRLKILPKSKK